MEKKRSIFGFLSSVFMIYGATILLLNIMCLLFGSKAQEVSSLFSLGNSGVSSATAFQFLLVITAVNLLRYLFMTDILIKNMSVTVRMVLMFASAFAAACAAIVIFGWFPSGMIITWILFIICFAASCTISTLISYAAQKQENDRLEEALKKFKEENTNE